MKYTTEILNVMDDQTEKARKEQFLVVNQYRQQYQKPHLRREFDLNDPEARLKDKPARVRDDDERCGVSGMQKFDGEDLEYKSRLDLQKEQMRIWTREQLSEKDRKRQEELNERRYVHRNGNYTELN